ncbi:MAG: hypothetical protein CMJ47_00470 [Planctomyces sp.]|nr:hypothetical protein [Planctomyces sp.]
MTRMFSALLAGLCLTAMPATGKAQNEAPNLNHARHLHHHNAPHRKEAASEKRFYTTRSSEVQLPLPAEEGAFTFAVFGDRTGGPADGVNVLAEAVRDVNLLEPDLVMTVGDLINGYNQTPKWMEQMREFKVIMNELLCPWFPAAGNHDVYWRPLDDPNMPRNQHDEHYEMHFGPLWYSFQHKDCNFIVLYSDEGNPETGEKNFSKPESQKISEEQLAFLKESLKRGKDANHQFLFLHHPRWIGGNYGSDWKDRVHPLLKETGNVTAVFAGHIHYMRSDPQDGIEYITLATVGGHQSGRLPEAGYLHQYHLITVRPEQVAMAAFPVGEALNVREITTGLHEQLALLSRQTCDVSSRVAIKDGQPELTDLEITITNPADRPIDFTFTPQSEDSNWMFNPTHTHGQLEPGESTTVPLAMRYRGTIDDSFSGVQLNLDQDYLAPTSRYAAPTSITEVPFDIQMPVEASEENKALSLDGKDDAVLVAPEHVQLEQGPFTLECWFQAESFSSRVGLLAKTQSSEYSIFMSKGIPSASVHLDGGYKTVRGKKAVPTGEWTHIAVVYDDTSLALFVNGEEVDRMKLEAGLKRTPNGLPLFLGADPGGDAKPMSFFHGLLDEVRLSSGAVYTENFTPERRLQKTDNTILLFNFDDSLGPIQFDRGPNGFHSQAVGKAKLVPVQAP